MLLLFAELELRMDPIDIVTQESPGDTHRLQVASLGSRATQLKRRSVKLESKLKSPNFRKVGMVKNHSVRTLVLLLLIPLVLMLRGGVLDIIPVVAD